LTLRGADSIMTRPAWRASAPEEDLHETSACERHEDPRVVSGPCDPDPDPDPAWSEVDTQVVEALDGADEIDESPADPLRPSATGAVDDAALADLVQRIVRQDEAAFAQFYRALSGRIYAQALRITRDIGCAEEVVEDVFWQVWRQAPRFDPARGNALAWVRRIARSRAIDALRALRSNPLNQAAPIEDDNAVLPSEPQDDPQHRLAHGQVAAQLEQALMALDPLRRQLVSLAFLRGLSQTEIAEQTGLPLGTVKSHIRRALTVLKSALPGGSTMFSTQEPA
jgi:RNA polymerase sigma factor (sigma-70 family)